VSLWKDLATERAQRKWPSWSAHIAWGALLVLAGHLQAALGWALLFSVICGFAWEFGWAVMTNPKNAANRASVGDVCAWILGSVAGALLSILWSK
jgi:hypothetical protein